MESYTYNFLISQTDRFRYLIWFSRWFTTQFKTPFGILWTSITWESEVRERNRVVGIIMSWSFFSPVQSDAYSRSKQCGSASDNYELLRRTMQRINCTQVRVMRWWSTFRFSQTNAHTFWRNNMRHVQTYTNVSVAFSYCSHHRM